MDLTYKADLRELNELNYARFDAKLEQRLAGLRAELRQEIEGLRLENARRSRRAASGIGGPSRRVDSLDVRLLGHDFAGPAETLVARRGQTPGT